MIKKYGTGIWRHKVRVKKNKKGKSKSSVTLVAMSYNLWFSSYDMVY